MAKAWLRQSEYTTVTTFDNDTAFTTPDGTPVYHPDYPDRTFGADVRDDFLKLDWKRFYIENKPRHMHFSIDCRSFYKLYHASGRRNDNLFGNVRNDREETANRLYCKMIEIIEDLFGPRPVCDDHE